MTSTGPEGATGSCPFNPGDRVRSRHNGLAGLVIKVDRRRALVAVAWGVPSRQALAALRTRRRAVREATLPAADLVFEPGSFRHPEDELARPATSKKGAN